MPEWRIYYADGSTFDSTQGAPADAPSFGVQAIVQRDKYYGRRILRMVDYYCWSPTARKWLDLFDSSAVILRAIRDPGLIVKAGEYIDEQRYEKILIGVTNDPDFPGKTPEKASINSGQNVTLSSATIQHA